MKLIIEPVVPQPEQLKQGTWVWRGNKTTKSILKQHVALHAPHRPDDPLDGGVVERVEAAQGSDIRGFEQMDGEFGANDWYWLFWMRED